MESLQLTGPSIFIFPRDYNFPPFFTLQVPAATLHAQSQKWSSLILAYCRHHRIWRLSLVDAVNWDLFWNKQLDKRLSVVDAREILEFMRREGRVEWVGFAKEADRNVAWVWWRTPEEWAAVIESWVDQTGQKGAVLTFYELMEGDATSSTGKLEPTGCDTSLIRRLAFHGMDPELFQRSMSVLVKKGKAQVFGQEDQRGVKFF